jgi:hypothetical protein
MSHFGFLGNTIRSQPTRQAAEAADAGEIKPDSPAQILPEKI